MNHIKDSFTHSYLVHVRSLAPGGRNYIIVQTRIELEIDQAK